MKTAFFQTLHKISFKTLVITFLVSLTGKKKLGRASTVVTKISERWRFGWWSWSYVSQAAADN